MAPKTMSIKDMQTAVDHRLLSERIEFLRSVLTEIGNYEAEVHASDSDLRSVLRYVTRIARGAVV